MKEWSFEYDNVFRVDTDTPGYDKIKFSEILTDRMQREFKSNVQLDQSISKIKVIVELYGVSPDEINESEYQEYILDLLNFAGIIRKVYLRKAVVEIRYVKSKKLRTRITLMKLK